MDPSMKSQSCVMSKVLPTIVAFIRLLPSMDSGVYFQRCADSKPLPTPHAFIRPLPCVHADVICERRVVRKLPPAVDTAVGFLPRVTPGVPPQVRSTAETLPAGGAHMHLVITVSHHRRDAVWPSRHVLPHQSLLGKPCPIGVPIKTFFTSVGSSVVFQF